MVEVTENLFAEIETAIEADVKEISALDARGEPKSYRSLNEEVHRAAAAGYDVIRLYDVHGQRFLAAGLEGYLRLEVHGTPGNDLGVFMDGPTIEVFGSAQDQAGNTMNGGKIVVHGNAWDVTGLAARGGKIFVRGDGGYRIGIHMKEFRRHRPVVVYGGRVREFFGEYMAGGVLVALGLDLHAAADARSPARTSERESTAARSTCAATSPTITWASARSKDRSTNATARRSSPSCASSANTSTFRRTYSGRSRLRRSRRPRRGRTVGIIVES